MVQTFHIQLKLRKFHSVLTKRNRSSSTLSSIIAYSAQTEQITHIYHTQIRSKHFYTIKKNMHIQLKIQANLHTFFQTQSVLSEIFSSKHWTQKFSKTCTKFSPRRSSSIRNNSNGDTKLRDLENSRRFQKEKNPNLRERERRAECTREWGLERE